MKRKSTQKKYYYITFAVVKYTNVRAYMLHTYTYRMPTHHPSKHININTHTCPSELSIVQMWKSSAAAGQK